MTVMPAANQTDEAASHGSRDDTVVAGTPVVVSRNAGVAALIGAAASAVAIGYLWRASQTMTMVDWALCFVLAGIAAVHLTALLDSRIPLLVADDLGVRIRLGAEWRGLPWEAVDKVVVSPRRGVFRDGRIMFAPHSLARALEGLDVRGRRHAALNQKVYGAALAIPVGLTTRVSTNGTGSVVEEIAALSHGRTPVIALAPESSAEAVEGDPGPAPDQTNATGTASRAAISDVGTVAAPAESEEGDRSGSDQAATEPVQTGTVQTREVQTEAAQTTSEELSGAPAESAGSAPVGVPATTADPDDDAAGQPLPTRRNMLGGIGTIVSRVAKARRHREDGESASEPDSATDDTDDTGQPHRPDLPAPGVASPLRVTRPALRAQVTRDLPATAASPVPQDPDDAPGPRRMHRPGSVDLVLEPATSDRVRPISTLGDPVEPLVVDDFATEPAYDPVIGPELAAARTRLWLSVDELADRTRIRPHVIESIEVDDFGPCGGDFYARGHLRTLARVLGQDVNPLLERFEERYATAPVNARRVFEAELATGMTGSMRGSIGGPNWGLLVGVVICLALAWGVVRLFAGEPAELVESPAPVLNGSAGVGSTYPGVDEPARATKPLSLMLTAAHGTTRVVVRDGHGRIAFTGNLALGEKKRLEVKPPVRVRAADSGAIEVTVQGRDRGVLGELGHHGRRTFR